MNSKNERMNEGGIVGWRRRLLFGFEFVSERRVYRSARLAATFLLAILVSLLAPNDDARAQDYRSKNKPTINASQLESRLHELVNAERVRRGLPALEHERQLRQIARAHSKDMAKRAFFAHISPEGRSPTERGNLKGYSCRKGSKSQYIFGIGENIHQAWLFDSYKTLNGRIVSYNWLTLEKLARRIVSGWINSKEHKENILNSSYDSAGMGVAIAKDGKIYSTQNFC